MIDWAGDFLAFVGSFAGALLAVWLDKRAVRREERAAWRDARRRSNQANDGRPL